jgi:paraquat-inducible protein B
MTDSDGILPEIPEAKAVSRRRTRFSIVWLIPVVAALAGVWVAATRILGEGPTITITFASAEGLEAGKTKIQFNGVVIGSITRIRLSEDHRHVIATADMTPNTSSFLRQDTKFWVVRPRISGATVSGLGTLISGAYVTLEVGHSQEKGREFVAIETPPVITSDIPGRYFVLKTPDLGSLDNGTPIFFRRLQVGQVTSYALDKDGRALTVKVFVRAPYDQYVNPNTHFWQASGVDVSLSAEGLRMETQSLMSMLIGGVAFETDTSGRVLPPAEPNSVFTLYHSRTEAFKLPAKSPQTYLAVFKESVRGLEAGAPVEFHGVTVGEVVSLQAQFNQKTFEVSVPVTIRIDPAAFGVRMVSTGDAPDPDPDHRKLVEGMVSRGVRAQLRSGNVLTGALYVALDFFPNARPVRLDLSKEPVEIPTVPGQIATVVQSAASIMGKLDQVPLKQIGDNLQKVLGDLDGTVVSGRSTLENANKLIEPNSELGIELSSTLQEVRSAAQSVRVLADYLERHPEALLRGKTEESK